MSDVPPDIITDIFLRLPVKSLVRFRCVSKPICALIDSPDFIKSQLDRSLKFKSNRNIVICRDDDSNKLYSIGFDVVLNKPSLLSQLATHVLGSCNGLLCLIHGDAIILYNPSTRQHNKLPFAPIFPNLSKLCTNVVYGFGYDHVNDDYKVVYIMQYKYACDFMVYSLKFDKWERVLDDEFPYYFWCAGVQNVLVNGALHWIVKQHLQKFVKTANDVDAYIVSFNLSTEKCCLIPMPKSSDINIMIKVGELGGKICLHSNNYKKFMDIWIMEQYGVQKSWTKLFSVAQPVDICKFEYVQAIAYSVDGEKVLLEQDGENLHWYDLKMKTVKRVRMPGLPKLCHAYMCMESLVKPTSCARTNAINKYVQEKNKKARGRRDDFLSKGFNYSSWCFNQEDKII